jgi:hypothetical protein
MTTRTHIRTAPGSQHAGSRIAARLLAAALDQRLAAGAAPEESVLLAARARQLSSAAQRQQLTRGWLAVLDRAARPPESLSPLSPRMPLRRTAIAGAQGDIRLMLAVVQGRPAIGAQGIALARMLLMDGAGPLYKSGSGADLAAAVRDATGRMRGS